MDIQITYNIITGWQLNHCVLQNAATSNSSVLQHLITDYGLSILTLFCLIHKYSIIIEKDLSVVLLHVLIFFKNSNFRWSIIQDIYFCQKSAFSKNVVRDPDLWALDLEMSSGHVDLGMSNCDNLY